MRCIPGEAWFGPPLALVIMFAAGRGLGAAETALVKGGRVRGHKISRGAT